eukprot:4065152-Ditylum_brightwellii.AAC.1
MSTNINENTLLPDPTNAIVHTPNKKPRAPIWMDGSDKHNEFITLCEQKQWETLPVLGGDADLDNFRKRGLNEDDDIEFSRTQLMPEFRK